MKKIFAPTEHQPTKFVFKDKKKVDEIINRYPKGRQQSAVMPLLDLAQRQVAKTGPYGDYPVGGGWIPQMAMEHIGEVLGMPTIRVVEVASFYSMYNMAPVGKFLVQLCTTTPCHLCGAADIVDVCEKELGIRMGATTEDGLFTLMDVECLGACVNAPMVQINDDYYEDLTAERMKQIIDALKYGKEIPVGSQKGRKCSMAIEGPTTLLDQAKKAGIV